MKTNILRKTCALLILVFFTHFGIAQITTTPYKIFNNKNCDVEIHWRIIDIIPSNCPALCNGNNIVITANSSISIFCAVPFGSAIEVVLLKVGGLAISPTSYVSDIGPAGACWGAGPVSDSGACPFLVWGPCTSVWSMTYSGTSTSIN